SSSSLLFLLTFSVSLLRRSSISLICLTVASHSRSLPISSLIRNRGHRCIIERRLPSGSSERRLPLGSRERRFPPGSVFLAIFFAVFLIFRHCRQPLPSSGSPNLELNLGIATPGHGLKENRGKLQFPWVPYSMHTGRTMVETNVNSVIGNLQKGWLQLKSILLHGMA
ncbi:uncharacterized protein LOC130945666, partial [Arachis stenosperma]|uniref:uncharacterized protein LOC130945666 n=1 Tax=Arachis stenosperma TaxID=217475 RepID=UPI0025AC83F7